MKENLVSIKLHGRLGEEVGNEYELSVKSPAEAFRALDIVTKHKFYKTIINYSKENINYRVLINGRDFIFDKELAEKDVKTAAINSELFLKSKHLKTIDFVPVLEGGDFATIVAIVIAVIAIGVAVATYFLAQPPQFGDFREIDGEVGRTSYLFNGPMNVSREGGPVPVGYGRLIIGSQVIASSYNVVNVSADRNVFTPGEGNPRFNPSVHINKVSAIAVQKQGSEPRGLIAVVEFRNIKDDNAFFETPVDGDEPSKLETAVIPGYHALIKFRENGTIKRMFMQGEAISGRASVIKVIDRDVSSYNGYVFVAIEGGDNAGNLYVFNPFNVSVAGPALNSFDWDGKYLWVETRTSGGRGRIYDIAILSDDSIVIVGDFTSVKDFNINAASNIDGNSTRASQRIAKLNLIDVGGKLNLRVDQTFSSDISGANNIVRAVTRDSNNNIIIVGDFTNYGGGDSNKIAKMNSSGLIDATFAGYFDVPATEGPFTGSLRAISVQSDDKIIVGGDFIKFSSTQIHKICRLNTDGTFDTTFKAEGISKINNLPAALLDTGGSIGTNNGGNPITIQTNNKILIGGDFLPNTNIDTVGRHKFCRLNSDGTIDRTFDSGEGLENYARWIVINPDSKNDIYIQGDLVKYNKRDLKNTDERNNRYQDLIKVMNPF